MFRSLQPPGDQYMRLVEYVLMGEAEHWWDQQRRGLEAANELISWDLFKTRFLGKYFPENVRREKEVAFLELKQGSLSVGEYAAQFEDLIRYSGSYRDADERTKCIKFEAGLNPKIRTVFVYQGISNLSQLVNMTSAYEDSLKQEQAGERSRASQRLPGPIRGKGPIQKSGPYTHSGVTFPRESGPTVNAYGPIPTCQHCGRMHRGVCWTLGRKEGLCFHCGQPGHFASNCPKNTMKKEINVAKAQKARGGPSLQKGKLFTVEGDEVDPADMVAGN